MRTASGRRWDGAATSTWNRRNADRSTARYLSNPVEAAEQGARLRGRFRPASGSRLLTQTAASRKPAVESSLPGALSISPVPSDDTPQMRSLRARIGAYESWARTHPTKPTRDRCAIGDRGNARSANLRAIGALGAAKRPTQLPQESRSGPVRCHGIGRDRDRPPELRDRETVDDFVDANIVDRMHRRSRSWCGQRAAQCSRRGARQRSRGIAASRRWSAGWAVERAASVPSERHCRAVRRDTCHSAFLADGLRSCDGGHLRGGSAESHGVDGRSGPWGAPISVRATGAAC
jgi:hypothetical protein